MSSDDVTPEEVTPEVPAAEVPAAEVPSAEVPAAEVPAAEVPSGDLPELTIGGESPTTPDPDYVPTIRGKVDRFGVAMGTGRRKTSVARVRVKEGNGSFRSMVDQSKSIFAWNAIANPCSCH